MSNIALTDRQISVLEHCRGRGISDFAASAYGFDQRLLNGLRNMKFIRYRLLARDPTWVITKEGREALRTGA